MRGHRLNGPGGRIVLAAALAFIVAVVVAGGQHRYPLASVAPPPPSSLPIESGKPWVAPLQAVDEALARRDIGAAERGWHRAYTAALGSRGWEGMLAVGDGALQIGAVAGRRLSAQAKARSLYLAALLRARTQRSVDGVLRIAEAFRALGDREVVEQCVVIARHLVADTSDLGMRARAAGLTEQFAAKLRGEERAEYDLF